MKKSAPLRILAALVLAALCSGLPGTTADASAGRPVVVTLALKGRDPVGLDQFLRQVYDPNSSGYHHFLARGEYDQRFGPSPATRQLAVRYMANRGFVAAGGIGNSRLVHFRGTGAAARSVAGASELRSIADYVAGPSSWHAVPRLAVSPRLGPGSGFTPAELRTLYQENGALAAGIDGTGQNVAVFELSTYDPTDVSHYDVYYNLTPPAPAYHPVDGGPGPTDNTGTAEVALDVEVINAMAPKAIVDIYDGPNTNQGVLDTYQQIANDDVDGVVSSSWGACEYYDQSTAPGFEDSQNQLAEQFAAQGQSFFLASGDSGSQACLPAPFNDPRLNTTDMDGPYTTVVGGTTISYSSQNNSISYLGESVWKNVSGASGGGLSSIYKESDAPWQSGPGVMNTYDSGSPGMPRQVPDVAADADPYTGYSVYRGAWTAFGGTSGAAPLWASIAVLAEQEGHVRLGNLNAVLYQLLRSPIHGQYLRDVTSGDNDLRCPGSSCPSPPDYDASAGFDPATGIGTPRISSLIAALVRMPAIPAPAVTPTPTRDPVLLAPPAPTPPTR